MPRTTLVVGALLWMAGPHVGPGPRAACLQEQQATASQPPAFRSRTDLIQVDAIVVDRSGQFVRGLQREDFEVLDDGARQDIQLFTFVDAPGAAATAASGAGATGGTAAVPVATSPRVFVFVLDHDNLAPGPFKRAQTGLRTFVERELRDEDLGGLVAGADRSSGRLTTDKAAVLAAIDKATPRSDAATRMMSFREWPRIFNEMEAIRIDKADAPVIEAAVLRACDDEHDLCARAGGAEMARTMLQQKSRQFVTEIRTSAARTLQRLRAISSSLAALEGRKTLVFISEGMFADEFIAEIRQMAALAARARVVFYPIDARGLGRTDPGRSIEMAAAPPDSGVSLDQFDSREDPASMFAANTGGMVIRNSNNVADALTTVARDTSTYYVLGYVPAKPLDGKVRSLKVRVRRDGVSVRARQGYLASPPAAPMPRATSAPVVNAGAVADAVPEAAAPLPSRPIAPAGAELARTLAPPDPTGHVTALADLVSGSHGRAAGESVPMTGNPDALKGWQQYQQGKMEPARALLARAAAEQSAPAWVSYALGWTEFALQRFDGAVAAWERVRQAVPEFRPVYFDLADAYLQNRREGNGVAVLREAERRWPADAEIYNALGVFQVRRGALDDAIESFKKGVQAAPQDAAGHFNLARTHHLRYLKSRRYNPQIREWVFNAPERARAIASYEACVKLGGEFEQQAREALASLKWQ